MESEGTVESTNSRQREIAACMAACGALCVFLWASLAVMPLGFGRFAARACGACVIVAVGAISVKLSMAAGDLRALSPRSAAFPLVAAACGAATYIVLAMALGALPQTASRSWGTALIPAGVVISSIGCLAWTWGSSQLSMAVQVKSHLQAAVCALPGKGTDRPRALDEAAGRAVDGDSKAPVAFCVAGCILFMFGAALCLAVPDRSLTFDWAASLACALACLCTACAVTAVLNRLRLHAESDLSTRKAKIDNAAGIAHAQIAVAKAEQKATEAELKASEEASKAEDAKREAQRASEQAARLEGTTVLEDACRRAAEEYGLSRRELDVLFKLAHGRSRPKIADALSLTISTVNSHVQSIYRKMSIHNSQQLIDILESLK